jgi:hypothetical protein
MLQSFIAQGYCGHIAPQGPTGGPRAVGLGRWECWREEWVLVQADAHEQLTLPIAASTAPRFD